MDCRPREAGQVNYYNDNDPKAAAWLRELIKQNLIPAGDVDERSITDVTKSDLQGYVQCHFFAGIGGWSEALRLAGRPADRPIWTGSCPCQPFSQAGERKGTKDPRHLWTEFYRLIAECNPPVVFGEQVASPLGRKWLAGVRADLEALGYAVGAADLCAAGVGAPHIRQRLWWVADTEDERCERGGGTRPRREGFKNNCTNGGVDDTKSLGRGILNTPDIRQTNRKINPSSDASDLQSFWSNSIWLPCRDGKTRRISPDPAFSPLADGIPGRVAMLRGFGNAIVPQVAAEFIRAYEECGI